MLGIGTSASSGSLVDGVDNRTRGGRPCSNTTSLISAFLVLILLSVLCCGGISRKHLRIWRETIIILDHRKNTFPESKFTGNVLVSADCEFYRCKERILGVAARSVSELGHSRRVRDRERGVPVQHHPRNRWNP